MKRLFKDKMYKVEKFSAGGEYANYGTMSGADAQLVVKGCKYDEAFEMYFTKGARIAYSVTEC